MNVAVLVAPKEASYQVPLTLPTSVGSTDMNYRKGKKSGCVTCIRERDEVQNTGHTAMAPTHNNLTQGIIMEIIKLLGLSKEFIKF